MVSRALVALFLVLMAPTSALAVTLLEGDILVADSSWKALLKVDPVTGDRTIVSGCFDADSGLRLLDHATVQRDLFGYLLDDAVVHPREPGSHLHQVSPEPPRGRPCP